MLLLIIDSDIEEVRKIKYLIPWRDYGFDQIQTAYNGEKAGLIAEKRRPDLVICDIGQLEDGQNQVLKQLKVKYPLMELLVIGDPLEKSQFRLVLRSGALDYLEKPVTAEELGSAVELFQSRANVMQRAELDIQNGKYWAQNHSLVQELFWKNLCLNRIPGGPEEIEESAMGVDADLDKDTYFALILVTLKNQDEMWSLWGEDMCQTVIQSLARAAMKRPEDACKVLVIYSRVAILITPEEFDDIEGKCNLLIQGCREELGAEIICYISEQVFCEKIAEVYRSLLSYSKDDVLKQQQIVRVKNRKKEGNEEIIIPKFWGDILYAANSLALVHEVRTFLVPLAEKGLLSEQNFRIFQQDMLQLFFGYMEKKELSAHELYDNTEIYKLYKAAIYSIDGMCQWVQSCVEYITKGIYGQRERLGERIASAVKEYITEHLQEDISVSQIASVIHLSPDYMTKVFKKETGMTIKEYMIKKRMKLAKEQLRNTEKTVSDVAIEVGYDNLSYFVRLFRNYYGVTPKQYQKQVN